MGCDVSTGVVQNQVGRSETVVSRNHGRVDLRDARIEEAFRKMREWCCSRRLATSAAICRVPRKSTRLPKPDQHGNVQLARSRADALQDVQVRKVEVTNRNAEVLRLRERLAERLHGCPPAVILLSPRMMLSRDPSASVGAAHSIPELPCVRWAVRFVSAMFGGLWLGGGPPCRLSWPRRQRLMASPRTRIASCGAWNPIEFSDITKSIMNCPRR